MIKRRTTVALLIGITGAACEFASIAGINPPCFVDINQDQFVDSADIGILLSRYGQTGPGNAADVDGDEEVGQSDLGAVGPYFGTFDCVNPFPEGALAHSAVRVDNSSIQPGDDEFGDPLFAGGVTHFTFDINVAMTGGSVWTTTSMQFVLEPSAPFDVYQLGAPFGDDETNWVFEFAALSVIYDTAVQSPADMGSSSVGLINTGVVSTPDEFSIDCWFSVYPVPMTPSDGFIARLSIVRTGPGGEPVIVPAGTCPGATRIGSVEVASTHAFTEGQLHTDSFEIIENPLVGDINGDLVVDTADLGILISRFGSDHPYSDINNDQIVDTADLGLLINEFGGTCP